MKKFIGTKIVIPTAMTRSEYNNYRNWDLPEDEDGSDEGYLVEYTDGGVSNHPDHKGYISWSPKAVFDNSYKELLVNESELSKSGKSMTFGQAVHYAKKGFKVGRSGWNGPNMFVYIVPEGCYPARTEAIKGVFPNDMVPYRAYWALKTAQNDVCTWAPSVSDTLAEDWKIW
jgi:hypothetical protein